MLISLVNGIFSAKCTHSQRLLFKGDRWLWSPDTKRWTTDDPKKAEKHIEFCTPEVRQRIADLKKIMHPEVALSMASDTAFFPVAPKGLAYLPYQRAGIEYAIRRTATLIADPPGLGKAQPVDEPVLTPTGWIPIGELSIGDEVIGLDGKTTKVTGVYPQGVKSNYRVKFRDGSWTRCCDAHLWSVKDGNRRKRKKYYAVKPLKELLVRGIHDSFGKNKWSIPTISPVQFEKKDYVIKPYTLGALLGDGSLHLTSPCISIPADKTEVLKRVSEELPTGFRLHGRNAGGCIQYTLSRPRSGTTKSLIIQELTRLKLRVTSKGKYIPNEYMLGSVSQRMDLLAGLLDTDGSCAKNRTVFHTCTKRLALDVQQLVWSLGGSATLREYARTREGKPVEYQVSIKVTFNPFTVSYKAAQWRFSTRNGPSRFIQSVEQVEDCAQVCISVDAPDCLYVTRDYTATHNTVQAIGVGNEMKARRVLIVCPASLKVNWSREYARWDVLDLTVGIVTTKVVDKLDADGNPIRKPSPDGKRLGQKLKETVDVWPDTDVVIISYELLDRHFDVIRDTVWDLLIVDEAHMIRNAKAKRSMHFWGGSIKENVKGKKKRRKISAIWADKRLFLTGTPLTKSPIDIWPFVQDMAPQTLGKNWKTFVYEFCAAYEDFGHLVVDGSSNEEVLQEELRRTFMVRRSKTEVLKELPSKRREIVLLPNEGLSAQIEKELSIVRKMLEAYEQVLEGEIPEDDREMVIEMFANLEPGDEEDFIDYDALASKLSSGNMSVAFTELSLYRKALAIAKAPMVVEHVQRLVDSGEKVVVMCVHKDVAKHLKTSFPNCAFLTGDTPSHKRQEQIDRFQNDPDCMVFVGNISAAGVGHTLTAASIMVFAELTWVPSELEQAEDRIWRIGQLNACLIQHLVVDGSLDSRMIEIILERLEVISKILDQNHLC